MRFLPLSQILYQFRLQLLQREPDVRPHGLITCSHVLFLSGLKQGYLPLYVISYVEANHIPCLVPGEAQQ